MHGGSGTGEEQLRLAFVLATGPLTAGQLRAGAETTTPGNLLGSGVGEVPYPVGSASGTPSFAVSSQVLARDDLGDFSPEELSAIWAA